jgi:hypothetical protein
MNLRRKSWPGQIASDFTNDLDTDILETLSGEKFLAGFLGTVSNPAGDLLIQRFTAR